MTLGRVKASARKITSGYWRWTSAMAHSQKAKGLVWGLSTRRMRMPWPIQKNMMSRHASHRALRSPSSAGHMLRG
jgi:hypothetical protein